jgi:hypothetical protein
MFSCINFRLIIVSLFVAFFATTSFAQNQTPISPSSSAETGTVAFIKMMSSTELRVEKFQLRESPGGHWITKRPNRFAAELYYRIQKDGITVSRIVPFREIDSIEFTTFVAKDAMYPMVRKMLIKLRDGGKIEWVHSDTSVTVTSPSGQKEKLKSFPWISGVVSSGQKEQGNDYVITGFTGFTNVNGNLGEWEIAPEGIKLIRFVGTK